ncbi:uncharacterized protein LOC125500589 [Athalia rosae]|uniref:uncharacterized protein LOC125500589 n=1 Tax=Athalia rosae TaxID=37344 RepID=UPI0020345E65|nr:uncharacterized protein LOC125500589 [Athalia rosae]
MPANIADGFRKLSTEPGRGLNVPRERSNATNAGATAITDVVQRKLGTSHRPTSNHKFARGRAATKRGSRHDGFEARRSSQMVTIPKTRFNQTNDFAFRPAHLGSIPAESFGQSRTCRTAPLHSDRELDDQTISATLDGHSTGADGISSPNHGSGCGDASAPSHRGEKSTECSHRVKRHAPEETTSTSQKLFGKPEQPQFIGRDCDTTENATSPRRQAHRPFVPNPTLSSRSTLPPKDTALCGEQCGQEELKKVTAFGFEGERSEVSARQGASQVSNAPNQITSAAVRTNTPWTFDDSITSPCHENQPIGGKIAAAYHYEDRQRDALAVGQSLAQNRAIAENRSSPRPREENERAYTPQEQQQMHHQRQRCRNQQGGFNAPAPQSSLDAYRLLQDNLLRQREMQRRNCIEQKRMMQAQQMKAQPCSDQNQLMLPKTTSIKYSCNDRCSHPGEIQSGRRLLPPALIPQNILRSNTNANQNQVSPRHTLMYQQNSLGQHCDTNPQRVTVHEDRAKNPRRVTFDGVKPPERWAYGDRETPCSKYESVTCRHAQQEQKPPWSQQFSNVQPQQQVASIGLSGNHRDQIERQRDDEKFQHQHQSVRGQETEGGEQQQHPMKEVQQIRLDSLTQRSRVEGKKNPEFTVEMIRDQELLVANLRQQNIPDDIMRRQFNTLLADQRRYLAFLEEQRAPETIDVKQSRAVGKVSPRCQQAYSMERTSHANTAIHRGQGRGTDVNQDCRTGMPGQRSPVVPEKPSDRQRHHLHDHELCHSEFWPSQQKAITPQSYNVPAGIIESSVHTSSGSPPLRGITSSRTRVGQLMPHEFSNLRQDQIHWRPQYPGLTTPDSQRVSKIESKEPSSLLKIREYNKYIRPQRQNNGLQELSSETMGKALTCSAVNKNIGFDYLVGIDKKVATVGLNGAQDPSELEKIMPLPPEYRRQRCSRVSANGLCDTRNSNKTALTSITVSLRKKTDPADDPVPFGYPRQYYSGEKRRTGDAPSCSRNAIAEEPNRSVQGAIGNEYRGDVNDESQVSVGHIPSTQQGIHKTEYATQLQSNEINDSMKPSSYIPTIPNKLVGFLQPQYQQNLRNTDGCGDVGMTIHEPPTAEVNTQNRPANLSFGNGGGDIARPAKQELRSVTCARAVPNEVSLITDTGQPNCEPGNRAHQPVAQDSPNIALRLASEPGQPEIQETRIIGGFTYLARRFDYVRQLSPIAPSTIKQGL